jgi:hypothetical protein
VFFWFLGLGLAFVWAVFRSPALDYRLVMAGSVLPVAEAVTGGPRLLHTLVFPVALLLVVALVTRGRRMVGRRWIGLPIGVLVHLVLDGAWTSAEVFWWPFFGAGFPAVPLPELSRGPWAVAVLEVIGVAALGWCWVTFGLGEREHRATFLRTGHLPRGLASSP